MRLNHSKEPWEETPPRVWRRRDGIFLAHPWRNTSTCVEKTNVFGGMRTGQSETPPHAWRRRKVWGDPGPGSGNTSTCVEKTDTASGRQQTARRNTSTCVEKTSRWSARAVSVQKHLHMRGEDQQLHSLKPDARETPPHAWRRPRHFVADGNQVGNTSTCVEKTGNSPLGRWEDGKHLHMRGEDARFACMLATVPETPPHAWRRLRIVRLLSTRFLETPPHAWRRPTKS